GGISGLNVIANSSMKRPLLLTCQGAVSFGPAVAVKLPDIAHFANLVQVQVGHYKLICVARSLGDDFAARVAEIALAVKLAYVPGLFVAHAIDRADEIAVCDGVRRLFKLPEIFR